MQLIVLCLVVAVLEVGHCGIHLPIAGQAEAFLQAGYRHQFSLYGEGGQLLGQIMLLHRALQYGDARALQVEQ